MEGGDPLWSEYSQYDRRVDIVSVAEVWFTRSAELASTVRHFERFPRGSHPDGNDATPDFTVLFNDGTAIAGELSHLALPEESLDDLARQLLRYSTLTEIQSGPTAGSQRPMQQAAAVDVTLFCPDRVANAACDRLANAIADAEHFYKPSRPPMVLAYGFDADHGTYTFTRPTRAQNDLLPDYGRRPSLSTWLAGSADTLRGLPNHFVPIKAAARFMNDDPPPLYTATVIWSVLLPNYVAEQTLELPADLNFTVDGLAARMQRDFGFGRRRDATAALEFLKVARLASEGSRDWQIHYRDLGTIDREISRALLHEYRSPANKRRPVRTARGTASAANGDAEDIQQSLL